MKAIKIIIVAAIAVALGFGIYKILEHEPENPEIEEIVVPEGCDATVASATQLIETKVNAVGDGEFEKLQELPDELRAFFVKQNIQAECMTSVNVIIRNRCLVRFIDMAKSEFGKKSWNWNNFIVIESMNKAFLQEEKDNADLKEFDRICKEYRVIVNYNSNVSKQSKQRPSGINSTWNYKNTETLLSKQPTASAPVSNTTLYDNTRKSAVQKTLHEGHVAFIDALLAKAKGSLPDEPTEDQYRSVINTVSNNDSEMVKYQQKAKSLYGVNSKVVNDNVANWNRNLDAFPKPAR